ncbi:MAG: DNA internalization-related competence protein ComEC/Rec2 [Halioglobus sp.]
MQVALSGLVVGIVLVGFSPALPSVFFLFVASTAAAFCFFRRVVLLDRLRRLTFGRFFAQLLVGLLAGVLLGTVYGYGVLDQQLRAECVNVPISISGYVDSLPNVTQSAFGGLRTRFEFVLDEPLSNGCDGPKRLQLSYYGEAQIKPGQLWRFTARLKHPRGLSNPGVFDAQYWFVQAGIHAVGSIKGEGTLGTPSRYWRFDQQWRYQLRERIRGLPLSEAARGVLGALTIADKSGIDRGLWEQFAALGINHLLVISGLHVGLVAGLGLLLGGMLAWPLGKFYRVSAALAPCAALIAAGGYMALAGFTLPTQRAFTMVLVFVVATAFSRAQPSVFALLYAACAVLLLNPLAALGSGFWLSFGAVLSLLWLAIWQRDNHRLRSFVATHAYMSLIMLPMGAFFFGGASVVSMLANAVLIPIIGLVVVPLALCAATASMLGFWGEWLLWILSGELIELLLQAIAVIAGGHATPLFWHTSGGVLGGFAGLIACVALAMPLRWRWRFWLLLLPGALLIPVDHGVQDQADTSITVIDVGQGTAVLVRAGARALLYDTGGGTPGGYTLGDAVVVPYLRSVGVTTLDTLIVSHQDADHSAGVADVLRAFPVARMRYGGEPNHSTDGRYIGKSCRAGEAWRWPGGQVFHLLAPAAEPGLSSNNGSCVLSIELAGRRFLLTGDIDGKRERVLARYWRKGLGSDALLVGHHGSKTSSYASFLKWVDPQFALVSAGYANRFGHPHNDVVERFRGSAVQLYNTAVDGAVTLEVSEHGVMTTRRSRNRFRPYWM